LNDEVLDKSTISSYVEVFEKSIVSSHDAEVYYVASGDSVYYASRQYIQRFFFIFADNDSKLVIVCNDEPENVKHTFPVIISEEGHILLGDNEAHFHNASLYRSSLCGTNFIQVFEHDGDFILVSNRGMLSPLHIVQYGEFYFDLVVDDDFEIQYIMSHETHCSRLWHMIHMVENIDIMLRDIPQFYRKYDFYFESRGGSILESTGDMIVGILATQYTSIIEGEDGFLEANRWGQGSMSANYNITSDMDGRLTIHNHGHDGWPTPLRYNTDDDIQHIEIEVTIHEGNRVSLRSQSGVLSQMPEPMEDGFTVTERTSTAQGSTITREFVHIEYEERVDSSLWRWLMDKQNAWQLLVTNPEPYIRIREITNDLWDKTGIQAFLYGGDVTLISREGVLSQLMDVYEDALYFNLITDNGFELLYIMYHEQPESALWQFLVGLKS